MTEQPTKGLIQIRNGRVVSARDVTIMHDGPIVVDSPALFRDVEFVNTAIATKENS